MDKNIYLIGLPGSGKSTLGRQIAAELGYTFVDTDDLLIAQEGKSIENIFAESGEDYFRMLERDLLHIFEAKEKLLISTGGGTPCFFDNLDRMNKDGLTVFIDVPPAVIHKRLISQRHQNRPMLAGKTDEEVLTFIEQKYRERIPYYSKAELIVEGANLLPIDVLEKILDAEQ
jgi:shikimate kinase